MPATLLVKRRPGGVNDDTPGRWQHGEIVDVQDSATVENHSGQLPEAGHFFLVTITDKTVEQVANYVQDFVHTPNLSVVGSQGNNYRIRVSSERVSATGKHGFTRAQATQLLADLSQWNASYHEHGIDAGPPRTAWFEFNVRGVTAEERDQAREDVREAVGNIFDRRREFYFTPAAMNFLANNNGRFSGTAQQVRQYIRSRLED